MRHSMTNSQKRVIISGANGYFGGIACDFFEQHNWQVLKATRQENSELFFDLDQPEAFVEQTLETSVDCFIHAAAAHEVSCRQFPYRSLWQNIAGTKAALEFCLHHKIPKFVYLSTFHVFGSPLGKIDENTTPKPANDYGLSHLQAEEYVQMYSRQFGIEGLVLRPSNFFGVPADISTCKRWTLTPLSFCREAVQNHQIVLQTPGYQTRNFVSVWDICEAILATFPQIQEIPLLHIYSPETLSIRDLALRVQKVMKEEFQQAVELTLPEGEPLESEFNYTSCYLSKIYQPTHRLEDFIRQFCHQLQNTVV